MRLTPIVLYIVTTILGPISLFGSLYNTINGVEYMYIVANLLLFMISQLLSNYNIQIEQTKSLR